MSATAASWRHAPLLTRASEQGLFGLAAKQPCQGSHCREVLARGPQGVAGAGQSWSWVVYMVQSLSCDTAQGISLGLGNHPGSEALISVEFTAQHPGRRWRQKRKRMFTSFSHLSGVSLRISGPPLCPSCPQHHAWNR